VKPWALNAFINGLNSLNRKLNNLKMTTPLKILVDQNVPLATEFFSEFGELLPKPGREITKDDCLDVDVLLVRSITKVDEALLSGTKVKFVGTCTIGIDHLDIKYLESQDIVWANAPGCNANAVIQYVLSAISSATPNWMNKTVGIIGCGAIGGKLYRLFLQLGVNCICYDPFLDKTTIKDLVSFEEVLQADIITLHTPLTYEGPFPTFHLLNKNNLYHIKKNALLINSSRGPVIDNQALLSEIERSGLNVVLDVWENEPEVGSSLFEKVKIGTPHIAGYSLEGKERGTLMIYKALSSFLKNQSVSDKDHLLNNEKHLLDIVGNRIDQEEVNSDQSMLNKIISECYNIEIDHQALKKVIEDNEDLALEFDRLRKNYPVRREFSHFELPNEFQGSLLNNWFKALANA
jgi:erythronate-4-phosphate dehydrogenase